MKNETGNKLVLALTFATSLTVLAQGDITPPKLVNLSFSPTTVDISATDQVITVTATITDDLSGIDMPPVGWSMQDFPGARITLQSPGTSPSKMAQPQNAGVFLDGLRRLSGSATNGIYTNTIIIPRYSEIGRWTVASVQLADLAGNSANLDFVALVRAGVSNHFNVQGSTNDITPPDILEFTATPITNDVSASQQSVFGQVRVRDDMGLDGNRFSVQVDFESPSASQKLQFYFNAQNKLSGDSTEAVYTNSARLAKDSEPGTWRLLAAYASDAAGNWKPFNASKMASFGALTEIQVKGQASGDITPPQVMSLALSVTNFNTTLSNGTLLVSVRITDDSSGIPTNEYNPVEITFGGPSGQALHVRFAGSMRESGGSLDGIYTNLVTLPTYLQAGLWLPIRMYAYDAARNMATWDLSDLSAQGWGSGFTIQNSPAIAVKETGGAILLGWPTPGEVFYLEGNPNLSNPTGWSRITTQPVEFGGQQIVPLANTTSNKFFRLTNSH